MFILLKVIYSHTCLDFGFFFMAASCIGGCQSFMWFLGSLLYTLVVMNKKWWNSYQAVYKCLVFSNLQLAEVSKSLFVSSQTQLATYPLTEFFDLQWHCFDNRMQNKLQNKPFNSMTENMSLKQVSFVQYVSQTLKIGIVGNMRQETSEAAQL